VGWQGEGITGKQFESKLKYWSIPCPSQKPSDDAAQRATPIGAEMARVLAAHFTCAAKPRGCTAMIAPVWLFAADSESATTGAPDEPPPLPPPPTEAANGEAPPPRDDMPPLPPGPEEGVPRADGEVAPAPPPPQEEVIEVPVFGQLRLSQLGMPALTLVVGLVDGFNPCAMWVLLFLLSILVNLQSRTKILAVAGTFVAISGLAYYAFMAAWLQVFMLLPHLEKLQIALGTLAIGIGFVHVKDFFAFKKGLTLSIPESAKPGIYARVRRIVNAENLTAAIIGASLLAVLVNLIELLCTAGLPALYSNILALQGYPAWLNYAYLGLYNLAYMFDDMLMVAIVLVTMSKHKLQETQGRWLKLVSGAAIGVLGLVMIFKPQWLT
jgi:hypothetical protein